MESTQIALVGIFIQEVETEVISLASDYKEFNKIEPKLHAERGRLMTPTDGKILVDAPIEAKAQHALDAIAKKLQVRALFHNTRDNEQSAGEEHIKLGIQKQEKQRQTPALKQQKEVLECDDSKLKPWRIVCIGAAIGAVGDAVTTYAPVRTVYPVLPALIICATTALAIGTSHHAYLPWIKRSKTKLQSWVKIGVVLCIAACFFLYVASLRTAATNSNIDIDPAYHQQLTTSVSPLAIGVISFILFVVVFALTSHFYVSKEEKDQIVAGRKAAADLIEHEAEIQAIHARQERLKAELLKQRAHIRQLNDYHRATVATIKSLAESARKDFQRIYSQYRSETPEFFAHNEPLQFNDHLNQFSEQQKPKE
jgi:hypothetical protein